MFFDNINDIKRIASEFQCNIFVVPKDEKVEIRGAWVLKPEAKTTITIEQVREILEKFITRQTEPQLVLIRPAELLSEEAANAVLKNLEEPKNNVHFLLITDELSNLLPTIRSRAAIYVWWDKNYTLNQIRADEKTKILAKRFLAAKPAELVGLAEEITKKKDNVRGHALGVLSVAIEMAYKSYFLTGKTGFLSKLPKFLVAHDAISRNGHVKLHLVADLV